MTDVNVRRRGRCAISLLVASPLALLLLALAAETVAGHLGARLSGTAVSSSPAVGGMAAAFVLFGKKRRDDEDDEALRAAALEAESGVDAQAVDEALLPRWRRPSLQQVRRTDPLRAAEAAPCLSFEAAGVRPLENFERRQIGYRLVRLLDSPDELRAREIGILDQGDEVQLLFRHGVYWLVLCPDGRQGWVHRMTLADPARPAPLQDDLDPMPQYVDDCPEVEVAEYADDPSTDGLLEAYMTARRDVLRTMADESQADGAAADTTVTFAQFQGATFAAPMPETPMAWRDVRVVDAPVAETLGPVFNLPVPVEETSTRPVPVSLAAAEPPSAESPAAGPTHAGEKYSARKSAGSRKAATASRPGTKSRRPSR